MPRYYFDLYNDVVAIDPEGQELTDLNAALAHALCEARTMIQASVAETGRIDLRHHLDIRDEADKVVYVLPFEDAVTVQRGDEVLSRGGPVRLL